MRDEYKIQRQGKTYVLYLGLLNEVHEKFVRFSIETELIAPVAQDKPIVKATFYGWDPEKPEGGPPSVKTSGLGTGGRKGDEKSPAARTAPLEMAETRAKARALRDAVNVGETAFEELSEGEASEPMSVSSASEAPVQRSTLGRLRFLATTYAETLERNPEVHIRSFEEQVGPLEDLSEAQATVWIRRYESGLDKLESDVTGE